MLHAKLEEDMRAILDYFHEESKKILSAAQLDRIHTLSCSLIE